MKKNSLLKTIVITCAILVLPLAASAQDTTTDPPFYFWRLGHMDGPHDSSRALGISRDGKVAVGSTKVVEFYRAWRMDIDWAISTDDGVPPLFNELQVQEDLGVIAPSMPSAAWAASNMLWLPTYDLAAGDNGDWGGSLPVGGAQIGNVVYGVEWIPEFVANEDGVMIPTYLAVPDFGGGLTAITNHDVSPEGRFWVGTGQNKRGDKGFIVDTTVVDANLVPIKFPVSVVDSVTLQTLQTSNVQAIELLDSTDDQTENGIIYIAGYGAASRGNRAFVGINPTFDAATPAVTFEAMYILPMIAGGSFAEAYAMVYTDEYGLIIAGRSGSPKGPQACIWFMGDDPATSETETWVVKALGGLSKKKFDSVAYDIVYRDGSPDGDLLVVGRSATILYPTETMVWAGNPVLEDELLLADPIGYRHDLEYILTKTGAGELSLFGSGWVLKEATGVSFGVDGTRIVGWGVNPEGGEEAFLLTGFPFELVLEDHEVTTRK